MNRKLFVGLIASLTSVALLGGCSNGNNTSSTDTSSQTSTQTTIPYPSTTVSPEEEQAIADAERVSNLINALNDSSTDAEILQALSAYNALSDLAKSKISPETKAKLDAKVEEMRKRKEELKIQEVITAIDALNDSSTKEEVLEVQTMYDSLAPELQERVTNKDKLFAQVKRVKEAAAKAMELVIDELPEPDDILLMDSTLLTKRYFEFTNVKKQYEQLSEEDLSYISAEKKQKYSNYASELDKSVYVVLDGDKYRGYDTSLGEFDWVNSMPLGNENFSTWMTKSINSGISQQQIHPQQALYLTDTRAIGFMVKPSKNCVVNYYSHMDKEYNSEGHIVADIDLTANEWNAVSSTNETPVPSDDFQLSRFDFNAAENWQSTDSIEITSIIGIRKRSEETDRRQAAIVEDEINALNNSSTKEDVTKVMNDYIALSAVAKTYISDDATEKLVQYISRFIVSDINLMIEETPTELTKETYFTDYNKIKTIVDAVSNLPEMAKSCLADLDKYNQIENLYHSIDVYFDSSSPVFSGWDYHPEVIKGITAINDAENGFVNKINVVGCNGEFSLQSLVTTKDYIGKNQIAFSIYNPTENDVTLSIHGGYPTGAWGIGGTHTLKAKSWNTIIFSVNVFSSGNQQDIGKMYLVFSSTLAKDGEWLITSTLDYKVACKHNSLIYKNGQLDNGSGTVEYFACKECGDVWADEEKSIYLGNINSDRSKIDITGEFTFQNNWLKNLVNAVYDEDDGYYFRTSLEVTASESYNPIETTDSMFTFESKGYHSCSFVLTNNSSSSIKVDVHTRAWHKLVETFDLDIGESKTVTITAETWDYENFSGFYGFALLCYNKSVQTGGTIDISRPVIQ